MIWWHAGKLGEWWRWHAHTFRAIKGLNAKMITLAENVFNLESINVWIISKQSKTTENKFHSFSSQFPTETKFWISLVDSVPYEVCYFLVSVSLDRSLVAYPTSVLRLAPWNLLRGKWLVSTWKNAILSLVESCYSPEFAPKTCGCAPLSSTCFRLYFHHYIFIISQLWLTSRPRSRVVLLDTETPGTSREIYSEDAVSLVSRCVE